MDNKTHALNTIAELVSDNDLTTDDLQSIVASIDKDNDHGNRSNLMRVLAYLGGTFLFAGIGLFISMNWDEMNSAARIVITLGSGIAVFVMAIVAQQDPRLQKATIPLFLLSAFLQGSGILVTFYEFDLYENWQHAILIMSGALSVQNLLCFLKFRTSTLVFLTLLFVVFFAGTALDLLNLDEDFIALVIGASIMLTCIGLDKTPHRVITPIWYLTASIAFLCGAFELLKNTVIEIIFLGLTSGMVYLSTVVRSRMLLFSGTVVTLSYIGYFTSEHFVSSFGWPLALIAFGLNMIGMSAFALRINKHYISESAT